ncbi:MAG: type IV pilin N-terminal domain-containing protein [Thermoplasmata archaeon]|nr:MAG: type IV pilin N-terminal domain-containing protein [Thermoplasmata archaeon]
MKIFRRRDEEAVSPVIAIILMVAITVVLASVLYVWVMNLADTEGEAGGFPSIEVKIYDLGTSAQDKVTIKHIQGDPLTWGDYKIIIKNNTNDDSISLNNLNPITPNQVTSGDTTTINSTVLSGLTLNFQKSKAYTLEIYDLQENKRVFQDENIICK